nr:ribosomal protein S3, chloroplastic [Tanacetum cinerariifolium]
MKTSSGVEGIARIEIQKRIDLIQIIIYMGFPKILIESRPRGIEELQMNLQKEFNSVNRKLNIDITRIEKPYGNPNILAEFIAGQLKNRVSFCKAMKKAIELTEQAYTKGIQVQIAGRIDEKEITRVGWIKEGRVPLQTIRAKIDYCSYTVRTIYGLLVLMAKRKCGHHSVNRRTAEVGNGFDPRDPRDVEIERLQQRIHELELQHEDQWSSKHTWDQDEGNPFSYVRGRRDRHGVDRQEDPLRSLGLRVEIPEFVSKSHPDDFIDWLSTVKRIFDLRDVPKKLKVKVVAMKLRQHTSLWWDHVKKQRYLAGKKLFWITNFSQGTFTVEEFINKFDRYVCGATQMKWKSILLLGNSSKAPRCYKCQGLGHYSREYPNQKIVSFVEEESEVIYDIDGNDVDESLEIELLYPDQGESLVIQRVLSVLTSKSIDDYSWHRNNIFRTKCTSKGKPSEVDSALVLNRLDFENVAKISPLVFVLVVEKANKVASAIPSLMQPLLMKFVDVVPEEIPPGLPMIKTIDEHLSHLRKVFSILREQKLHANRNKCHFLVDVVTFLGNVLLTKDCEGCSSGIKRCKIFHIAKTHGTNAGLYTPLLVHEAPWEEVNLDFVLGLPRTQCNKYYVMVVVDRQTEVTNRSLGNLPRNLNEEHPKQWDLMLPQAEFAYNQLPKRTIGKTLFEIVYGRDHITPFDLIPILEKEPLNVDAD